MPSIAITGGIACGKSSVMTFLAEINQHQQEKKLHTFSFFDADKEVAFLLDTDPNVAQEITTFFGTSIYDGSQKADRSQLRSLLLASVENKNALEAILHPRLRKKWYPQAMAAQGASPIFIADIPLLYEKNLEAFFDHVLVIAASEETQYHRLITNRHLSPITARQLISLQLPLTEKMKHADHVLWNDGSQETFQEELSFFLKSFL